MSRRSIQILLQHPHFLVLNKPPHTFSQPPGHPTVLELLAASYPKYFTPPGLGEPPLLPPFVCPPKLVHRLDAPVSGAFVVALSDHAARQFGRNLKHAGTNRGSVLKKTYIAVLENGDQMLYERLLQRGLVTADGARQQIGVTFGENAESRGLIWEGVVESPVNGKPASTRFWLRGDRDQLQRRRVLVAFEPITGRKHQLRVHASEVLGCPIVGDTRYGGNAVARCENEAIALHAAKLNITFGRSQFDVLAPFEWNQELWKHYIGKDRLLLDCSILNHKKA